MINNNEVKNKKTDPRFEFRIFGNNLTPVVELFYNLFSNSKMTKKVSVSDESYIISQIDSDLNIKLRDNFLDIKKLITKNDSLEQWEPFFKTEFPIDLQTLKEVFLDIFEINSPSLNQNKYTKEQFLKLIQRVNTIDIVKVHKRRTQYAIDDIFFEIADVDIDKTSLQTICLESENQGKLQKFLTKLHINNMKNTNYVKEIKLLHQNVLR